MMKRNQPEKEELPNPLNYMQTVIWCRSE